MADTTADTGLLPRTYFRAPRVPLDLRALAIAILGFGVFTAGGWLLSEIFKEGRSPVGTFFREVFSVIAAVPYVGGEIERLFRALVWDWSEGHGNFWSALVGGTWFFVVWAFFGQAIHRITALRIARDEGLSLKEAFRFSARNFVTILLCPVIVAGAIGLFYGCNALAGAVVAIPWAGQVIGLVALPLAVISTLLILLVAIGGVIGMPLVAAAAAWERNGSLDAISRAFSYIFARPLQFFWNYFLIFLFTSVLLIAGGHFERILYKSVDAGIWRDTPTMLVDTPSRADETYQSYDKEQKDLYASLEEKAKGTRPFAKSIKTLSKAPASDWLTSFTFWVLLNLIEFGVMGAVLWWFLGATTSTYADLRADVDGTEEDEIYLEEEEQDFEALAKPPEGGVPPPPPPAGGPETPPAPAVPPPPPPPPPPV